MSALHQKNFELLKVLLTSTQSVDEPSIGPALISNWLCAAHALPHDLAKLLPDRERQFTPSSCYYFDTLRQTFAKAIPDDAKYLDTFDRFEYLMALTHAQDEIKKQSSTEDLRYARVLPGTYMWRGFGDFRSKIGKEIAGEREQWPPLANGLFDSLKILLESKEMVDARRIR